MAHLVESVAPEPEAAHDRQGNRHPGHDGAEPPPLHAGFLTVCFGLLLGSKRGLFLVPLVAAFLDD